MVTDAVAVNHICFAKRVPDIGPAEALHICIVLLGCASTCLAPCVYSIASFVYQSGVWMYSEQLWTILHRPNGKGHTHTPECGAKSPVTVQAADLDLSSKRSYLLLSSQLSCFVSQYELDCTSSRSCILHDQCI